MIAWAWHAVVALWVGSFLVCVVWALFSRCPAWLERLDGDDWRNEAEERVIRQQADFVLWEVGQ